MKSNDKKKKAAIAAVMYYLNEKKDEKITNKWVQLGRKINMRNRYLVQTKNLKH